MNRRNALKAALLGAVSFALSPIKLSAGPRWQTSYVLTLFPQHGAAVFVSFYVTLEEVLQLKREAIKQQWRRPPVITKLRFYGTSIHEPPYGEIETKTLDI